MRAGQEVPKIQVGTTQHIVPFHEPTGYQVMKGGARDATALVDTQDRNLLKPSGTRLMQPLGNAQANPPITRVPCKAPQEGNHGGSGGSSIRARRAQAWKIVGAIIAASTRA